MVELKQQEASQRESKCIILYEKWKKQVKASRTMLKDECSYGDLDDMMDAVEEQETQVKEAYGNIRSHSAPSTEIRRKMDSCTAVTRDLMGLMKVRMSELGQEEFDAKAESARLHMVLDREYAQSIFESSMTKSTVRRHHLSRSSEQQSITAKRAECAAELAAKKAEMNMEEAIAAQKQQLIAAKLTAYSEADTDKVHNENKAAHSTVISPPVPCKEIKEEQTCHNNNKEQTNNTEYNEASLVQALHDTMVLQTPCT